MAFAWSSFGAGKNSRSVSSTGVPDVPGEKPQVIWRADMTGSFEMREGETTPVSPSGFRTRFTRVPRGRRAPAGILAESPPLLGRSLHRDYGNCDAIFSLGAVFDF